MIPEQRLKSHYESLARAIGFVRAADAKAAPVLGLQVALVGTLAVRFDRLWADISNTPWEAKSLVVAVLLISYSCFLFAVIVLAARVYMPTHPRTERSLIYFEDISSMEYEDFEARAKDMSGSLIETQLLDQIYRISQVVRQKMYRVKWAFVLTGPTCILWVALMIWGST